MPDRVVLVALIVFALVFQAVWLFSTAPEPESEVIARRLSPSAVPAWLAGPGQLTFTVLRRRRYSRLPWLDWLLARLDLADSLGRSLVRAGIPMRGGEFVFVQIVGATLGALAGILLGFVVEVSPLVALATALVGGLLPLAWLRWMARRRLEAFEAGLADALDRIAASLRAGFGLEHGLDAVSRGTHGPCAEEFGQVLQELNLGGDLDEALQRMQERIDSEDARLLATAVSVQRRTGGNLVEVLAQMAQVIRERQRMRREVRVITTAPRVSGYVVALLPLLTLGVMYLTSRYYVETLFGEPVGRLAVAVSAVLVVVGLYLNSRIARVEL
jgi:tight adherence protein B